MTELSDKDIHNPFTSACIDVRVGRLAGIRRLPPLTPVNVEFDLTCTFPGKTNPSESGDFIPGGDTRTHGHIGNALLGHYHASLGPSGH